MAADEHKARRGGAEPSVFTVPSSDIAHSCTSMCPSNPVWWKAKKNLVRGFSRDPTEQAPKDKPSNL